MNANLPESLESQVERLANFIMQNIPGEPSQSQGAVDTAIRLLTALQSEKEAAERERDELRAALVLAVKTIESMVAAMETVEGPSGWAAFKPDELRPYYAALESLRVHIPIREEEKP